MPASIGVQAGKGRDSPSDGRLQDARVAIRGQGEPGPIIPAAGSGRPAVAVHFQRFAEVMYQDLRTGAQVASLERGDAEAANIEEALDHLHLAAAAGDAEVGPLGLRMCGDLWMYWHVRGLHIRARDWSRRFLEAAERPEPTAAGPASSPERARALMAAAVASVTLGDPAGAVAEIEEGRAVAPPDDEEALGNLALTMGVKHLTTGDLERARTALDESVRRFRAWGGAWELGIALTFKGMAEAASGDPEAAHAALDEALSLQRPIDDHEGMGGSISGLAALEAGAGNRERALELYGEAFDHFHAIGDRPEEARPERAVRIAAASATFSEREGVANDYAMDTSAPGYLQPAREALDPAMVAELEAEGRELSVEAAVRLALNPERETLPQPA